MTQEPQLDRVQVHLYQQHGYLDGPRGGLADGRLAVIRPWPDALGSRDVPFGVAAAPPDGPTQWLRPQNVLVFTLDDDATKEPMGAVLLADEFPAAAQVLNEFTPDNHPEQLASLESLVDRLTRGEAAPGGALPLVHAAAALDPLARHRLDQPSQMQKDTFADHKTAAISICSIFGWD